MVNTFKYFLCMLLLAVVKKYSQGLSDDVFYMGLVLLSAIYMIKKSVLYHKNVGNAGTEDKKKS